MFRRGLLAGSMAVFLAGAYSLYARFVVPHVEPKPDEVERSEHTAAPAEAPSPAPANTLAYRVARAAFGPDAWQASAGLVLQFTGEQSRTFFYCKDYQELPNHELLLKPLSIVMLHVTENAEEVDAANEPDEVSLESSTRLTCPQARLQFDTLELTRLKTGRPIGGLLEGEIEIRHRRPGTSELALFTENVQFTNDTGPSGLPDPRLTSRAPVRFSDDENRGEGVGLDVLLVPDLEKQQKSGVAVSGIRSVSVRRDVRLSLNLKAGTTGFGGRLQRTRPGTAAAPAGPTPVDIRCAGPFRYDLESNTASFYEEVDVTSATAEGPPEQIRGCDELHLTFLRSAEPSPTPGRPNLAFRRFRALGRALQLDSPQNGIRIVATSILHDAEKRVTHLRHDGGQVDVVHSDGEMHAPQIDLEQDEAGGIVSAAATGSGWLKQRRPSGAGAELQAAWRESLSAVREADLLRLTLTGDADVREASQGRLRARQIAVWVNSVKRDDAEKIDRRSQDGQQRMSLSRLAAAGDVSMDSPQLAGNYQRLEMWFKEAPAPLDNQPPAPAGVAPGAATSPQAASPVAADARAAPPPPRLQVDARLLQVQLVQGAAATDVAQLYAEGDVEVRQQQAAASKPLKLRGQELRLEEPQPGVKVFVLTGRPAEVHSEEMELYGRALHLDRTGNRLRVEGAGQLMLAVNRDLEGGTLETPEQLDIRWIEGMWFDGTQATFRGAVTAKLAENRLACPLMEVFLSRAISFTNASKRTGGEPPVDIRRIVCRSDRPGREPVVELVKRADKGPAIDNQSALSVELEVDALTGDVIAKGPGQMVNVKSGGAPGGFGAGPLMARNNVAGKPGAAARVRAQDPPAARPALNRTQVQFAGEMTGNLRTRHAVFREQVHVLFGPVDDVDDRFDRLNLPEGGLWMQCRELALAPDTVAAARSLSSGDAESVEMTATGNVKIEVRRNGQLFANGERVTYSQAKEQLVLEGTPGTPAQIEQRRFAGGPSSTLVGNKITYTPERTTVDAARSIDAIR